MRSTARSAAGSRFELSQRRTARCSRLTILVRFLADWSRTTIFGTCCLLRPSRKPKPCIAPVEIESPIVDLRGVERGTGACARVACRGPQMRAEACACKAKQGGHVMCQQAVLRRVIRLLAADLAELLGAHILRHREAHGVARHRTRVGDACVQMRHEWVNGRKPTACRCLAHGPQTRAWPSFCDLGGAATLQRRPPARRRQQPRSALLSLDARHEANARRARTYQAPPPRHRARQLRCAAVHRRAAAARRAERPPPPADRAGAATSERIVDRGAAEDRQLQRLHLVDLVVVVVVVVVARHPVAVECRRLSRQPRRRAVLAAADDDRVAVQRRTEQVVAQLVALGRLGGVLHLAHRHARLADEHRGRVRREAPLGAVVEREDHHVGERRRLDADHLVPHAPVRPLELVRVRHLAHLDAAVPPVADVQRHDEPERAAAEPRQVAHRLDDHLERDDHARRERAQLRQLGLEEARRPHPHVEAARREHPRVLVDGREQHRRAAEDGDGRRRHAAHEGQPDAPHRLVALLAARAAAQVAPEVLGRLGDRRADDLLRRPEALEDGARPLLRDELARPLRDDAGRRHQPQRRAAELADELGRAAHDALRELGGALAELGQLALLDARLDVLPHLLARVLDAVDEAERVAEHVGVAEELAELPRRRRRVVPRRLPAQLAGRGELVVGRVGEERERRVGDRGEVGEHRQHRLRPARHLREQLVVDLQQLADRVLGAVLVDGDRDVEDQRRLARRLLGAVGVCAAQQRARPRDAHRLDVHAGERRRRVVVLEDAGGHDDALLAVLLEDGEQVRRAADGHVVVPLLDAVAVLHDRERLEQPEVDDEPPRRQVQRERLEDVARALVDVDVHERRLVAPRARRVKRRADATAAAARAVGGGEREVARAGRAAEQHGAVGADHHVVDGELLDARLQRVGDAVARVAREEHLAQVELQQLARLRVDQRHRDAVQRQLDARPLLELAHRLRLVARLAAAARVVVVLAWQQPVGDAQHARRRALLVHAHARVHEALLTRRALRRRQLAQVGAALVQLRQRDLLDLVQLREVKLAHLGRLWLLVLVGLRRSKRHARVVVGRQPQHQLVIGVCARRPKHRHAEFLLRGANASKSKRAEAEVCWRERVHVCVRGVRQCVRVSPSKGWTRVA